MQYSSFREKTRLKIVFFLPTLFTLFTLFHHFFFLYTNYMEEEIFEKPKPKPKRVLTEKQKEALAKGRAKVKENKEKKLKSSVELKTEQREEKKKLTKRQEKALEQVRKNKKLDEWDEMKCNMLSTMPDENSYNLLNNYLDKLTEEDILDKKTLKSKIGLFAKHLHERAI